jgi:protocatechuate 3,4-dioxygenase beta subunit
MLGSSLPRALVAALLTSNVIDGARSLKDRTSPSITEPQYKYTSDRRHLQDEDETIILFFHGTVLNDLWEPVNGAQVQFWHTDKFGIYNHPQDLKSRGNPPLQPDFQYFGTATSDTSGKFDFITYRPGIYQGRPITHIHYKVFLEGQELLTSQFYFADEGNSKFSNMMVLDLVPVLPQSSDDPVATEYFRAQNNAPSVTSKYFETSKTIVIDLNLGGTLATTPSQTEGPFYPVVDFFQMGNDLTRSDATPPTDSPGGDASTTVPLNDTSPNSAADNNASSSAGTSGTTPNTTADNTNSSSSATVHFAWMLSAVVAGGFGHWYIGIALL